MSDLNYINKEIEIENAHDDYIENYVNPLLSSLDSVLYYIVYEGTNKRILNFDHTPFICSGDVVDEKLSFYESKINQPLEYIQVDEYQSVFGRYEA